MYHTNLQKLNSWKTKSSKKTEHTHKRRILYPLKNSLLLTLRIHQKKCLKQSWGPFASEELMQKALSCLEQKTKAINFTWRIISCEQNSPFFTINRRQKQVVSLRAWTKFSSTLSWESSNKIHPNDMREWHESHKQWPPLISFLYLMPHFLAIRHTFRIK